MEKKMGMITYEISKEQETISDIFNVDLKDFSLKITKMVTSPITEDDQNFGKVFLKKFEEGFFSGSELLFLASIGLTEVLESAVLSSSVDQEMKDFLSKIFLALEERDDG